MSFLSCLFSILGWRSFTCRERSPPPGDTTALLYRIITSVDSSQDTFPRKPECRPEPDTFLALLRVQEMRSSYVTAAQYHVQVKTTLRINVKLLSSLPKP